MHKPQSVKSNIKRATTTERGYGHRHVKARAALLKTQYYCERCKAIPKTPNMHHKDRNPHNRELSNLEILCETCHRLMHKS